MPETDAAPALSHGDDLRLQDFWSHDPFVLPLPRERTYLLYTAARDRPEVVVHASPDLQTWSGPTTVFRVPETGWADPGRGPWAPEVHHHDGRFYLLTTLHDPRTPLPAATDGSTTFTVTNDGGAAHSPVRRATMIAVADSPYGPFELLDPARPVTDPSVMTLDGTLVVDRAGVPWMVYAHEWVQLIDGSIEAVPLTPDLRSAAGDPVLLFRGSQAAFLDDLVPGTLAPVPYVTDGPQVRTLPGGALAMLWSTYRRDGTTSEYVQTWALSRSGALTGPWEQQEILVDGDAGHGMLFETFEGGLRLVLHRPMHGETVRAEIHEVLESPDSLRVLGPHRG